MKSKKESEYVLGSSDREIERLAYQHEIWFEETSALWEKASLGIGSHVADFGCGPGFCTEALARLVGYDGHVFAVDASEKFASIVEAKAAATTNISFHRGDVTATPIKNDEVDAVFARWLYCFLPDHQKAIDESKRILKPGGRIIIFDYFNYLASDVYPQNPLISQLFEAFSEDVQRHDGNWDVGGELPSMLAASGFRIDSLTPIIRIGKPGSRVWKWVEYFAEVTIPRIVEKGIWTGEQRAEFEAAWDQAAQDPGAFFFTPPMIGIVATLN